MVDAVTATADTAAAAAKLNASRTRLTGNFETFLTMLTTQLRNQDPTAPLDTNKFTEQLVSMTGVEQQLLANELLQKLVDKSGGGVNDAISLIGKTVRAETDVQTLKDGKAAWGYTLPAGAESATLTVRNAAGSVVWSGAADSLAAGEHAFSWDGRNTSGGSLPAGDYSLTVTATGKDGVALPTQTFVEGRVTSVETVDGGAVIQVGPTRTSVGNVVSVREAAAA